MLREYRNIIYLLFLVLSVTSCSYTKDLTVLTRKQAISDLDYLVKNLKAVHPDPFTRIGEEAFNTHIEKVKSSFGDKVNRNNELASVIAETLALLNDSHTRHDLFPLWGGYHPYVQAKVKMLPLALNYEEGHVIVNGWAKAITPERMKIGDAVVSINNKPIRQWLEKYYKYFSAETVEQKRWRIPYALPACIVMTEGKVERFDITLKNTQGQIYQEDLPAALPEFPDKRKNARWGEFPYQFYSDGHVCHFKIPSFGNPFRHIFFKILDTLLYELKEKGTSILIVDLRGNGGGHGGLGQELLRRTVSKPFKTGCKKWRYSRAYERNCIIYGLKEKNIPPWLLLDRWLRPHWFYPRYYPIYVDPSQLEGEYFCCKEGGLTCPNNDHWTGTLVLIIDHGTASAAVDTAVIVKDNAQGLVVGEETGGRASYFAEICPVYLPNSGLFCVISSAHMMRPAGYDDGRGVLPDVPLDVTLEDSVLIEKICDYIQTETKL